MRSESKLREHPYAIPVEVNLVPLQTVAGRDGMGMMVIVPTFAESEQRHPPAIGRSIPGLKAARAPKMRRGVDQPGGVESHHGAQKNAPQQEGQSAHGEKCQTENDCRNELVLRDPNVKLVRCEVRDVASQRRSVLTQSVAG